MSVKDAVASATIAGYAQKPLDALYGMTPVEYICGLLDHVSRGDIALLESQHRSIWHSLNDDLKAQMLSYNGSFLNDILSYDPTSAGAMLWEEVQKTRPDIAEKITANWLGQAVSDYQREKSP